MSSSAVLSTHIVDTVSGQPAAALFVELYKYKTKEGEGEWLLWHNTATTVTGRVLFPFSEDSMGQGIYKLKFRVGEYYARKAIETLYPCVEITFEKREGQHYHLPLLLGPFGYTTYRGN